MNIINNPIPDNRKKIWIIEDNKLFRDNLKLLIDSSDGIYCECGFSNMEDALKELKKTFAPDLFLVDIGLPGISGIEGIPKIKAISPGSHIIIITVYDDDDMVFKAICSGATGYLLKNAGGEEIIKAIYDVFLGGSPMNAFIARKILETFARINTPQNDYGLTEREKQILECLVKGLTKKKISTKLFLSFHTVDTHLRSIYNKLHVNSRSDAVVKTVKERIL
ncbi:MAG: response regulator [Syntrophomonadaceae bacterium]